MAADIKNGAELTLEERVAALEERVEAAKAAAERAESAATNVGWGLVAVVVAVSISGVAWAFTESRNPAPTNRDRTLDELLSEDVHCYDSPEERASARQRALQAIDFKKWERDRLVEAAWPADQMWGPGAPPTKLPSVWDTPQGQDASLCFEISYQL